MTTISVSEVHKLPSTFFLSLLPQEQSPGPQLHAGHHGFSPQSFSPPNLQQLSAVCRYLCEGAAVTCGAATRSWILSLKMQVGCRELLPCLPQSADGVKIVTFHLSRTLKSET